MRHANAFAPGRCTVVGEHVDYADGVVVCVAVHLGITVRVAPSADGEWHAPGKLPLATVQALRDRGVVPTTMPPLDVEVSATLPSGAGLSSSAALCGATAVAVLRLLGAQLSADELADAMLHAERDIAGVPCGPLDQRAVVRAPDGAALVLDCHDGTHDVAPWLHGYVLTACHTGDAHDVGGEGYRARREQVDAARRALGVASYRDVTDVDALSLLDPLLMRRARHVVTETARAAACADALRRGDAETVGRLMHASHASLRDDFEVSTAALDAAVAAAEAVPGCRGARLCGAGFGGTAVALVEERAAARCLDAMGGGWVLRPSPGLAALAPDVIG